MSKVSKEDLNKIGTVTLVGIAAILAIVFWLKGHKIHHYNKFSFYFRNVNGLEEGNALRWNGLKIGVVESIKPVTHTFVRDPLPAAALIDLGERHLKKAKNMLLSDHIEDLVLAQEEINKAQLEIALGKESSMQNEITEGDFVEVNVVVTMPDVPIGPFNQVTIVPSGVIGEQYVDISTIDIDVDFERQYDITSSRFVVLEPVKLDTLIRANAESAEAIRDLTNRLNALFSNEDAENVKQLLESVTLIANDRRFQKDLKQTAKNLNAITTDFSFWKLIFGAKPKEELRSKNNKPKPVKVRFSDKL